MGHKPPSFQTSKSDHAYSSRGLIALFDFIYS